MKTTKYNIPYIKISEFNGKLNREQMRRYKILIKNDIDIQFPNSSLVSNRLIQQIIPLLLENYGIGVEIPKNKGINIFNIPKSSSYHLKKVLVYLSDNNYIMVEDYKQDSLHVGVEHSTIYIALPKLLQFNIADDTKMCRCCKIIKDISKYSSKTAVCKTCTMEIMRYNRSIPKSERIVIKVVNPKPKLRKKKPHKHRRKVVNQKVTCIPSDDNITVREYRKVDMDHVGIKTQFCTNYLRNNPVKADEILMAIELKRKSYEKM